MIGGVVNIKTIHFDFIYVHFANTVLRNIKFALHGTLNFTHDHILKEDRPFRRYSNLTHDDDLEWPSNVDCWIFWIDFLVVLYYFFIKRHVETVKPIPKWFKTVCSDSLWNIYVVIDFSSRNIFFFGYDSKTSFSDFETVFLFWTISLSEMFEFSESKTLKRIRSRNHRKSPWSILIISKRFFDFRLVKNHFRFSYMKSKYEIFDFNYVWFRKPLKNPVETSFSVLLFMFYLSLEYLWFWNIYTLVFLSLFLLAQNFLVERGDEK